MNRVGGLQRCRQQRAQQSYSEFARCDAFVALRVLVDHGVETGRTGTARFAEGDLFARDILQLDCDVFQNVTEPGSVVFAHAPQESAGHLVGTAMFGKTGQRLRQGIDELRSEAARGPRFEST